MTEPDTTAGDSRPDVMERPRDRAADQLELIISSLTIFALFSLPGWILARVGDVFTHLSTSLVVASSISLTILSGVSYGLAACFVVHLMARSYWVGLIGLRTVFPDGINWDKTPGMGPLSRQYYRDSLPDLETVIHKADRLASSLFAVISMLTLSFLWLGTILVVVLVASAAIGARYGQTNAALGFATIGLATVFAGIPLLVYLLDAQLASRLPSLRDSRLFAGLIRFLKRVAGVALPQRLVLPVQLTLQSNTRPVIFYIALTISVVAIVVIGNFRVAAWQNFTVSSAFTYLDSDDVRGGLRSVYYEDMPSELDRLRGWPRVDSFNQGGSFARLFLPYQPLRDNLILEEACGSVEETEQRVGCLRQLWSVSIEGEIVPMEEFIAAERADLGMRGLVGLVPLDGLEPGLKRIQVIWNPDGEEGRAPVDDRYTRVSSTYDIPIAFSPAFERALD